MTATVWPPRVALRPGGAFGRTLSRPQCGGRMTKKLNRRTWVSALPTQLSLAVEWHGTQIRKGVTILTCLT